MPGGGRRRSRRLNGLDLFVFVGFIFLSENRTVAIDQETIKCAPLTLIVIGLYPFEAHAYHIHFMILFIID